MFEIKVSGLLIQLLYDVNKKYRFGYQNDTLYVGMSSETITESAYIITTNNEDTTVNFK